jgi:hypothetical protein
MYYNVFGEKVSKRRPGAGWKVSALGDQIRLKFRPTDVSGHSCVVNQQVTDPIRRMLGDVG